MLKSSTAALVIATTLLLVACEKKEAALPTINRSMTEVMQPQAEVVWNTVSKAYNDVGDALDPAKLSEDDWKKLADASQQLKDRAMVLANGAHRIKVVSDTETIMGENAATIKGNIGAAWEAASAKLVQQRIVAKPELFSDKAKALAATADDINRAAKTKDVGLLYKATANVDEVCDGCHEPFWGTDEPPPYPKSAK